MRDNPDLKLVVLGQARPDRVGRDRRGGLPQDDRGHQPGRRVRQRAHGRRARASAARKAEPSGLAARAAAGDPRRGVLRAREGADGRHLRPRAWSSSPPRRPSELVKVGAPCPDHLVHTKRLPLWISREDATPRAASPSSPTPYRDDYRAYFEAQRRRGRRARRPGRADRARRGHGHGRPPGTTTKLVEGLARPLPPRDRGDGGRRRRSASSSRSTPPRASRSSTGRWSSTSSRRRRRPASCRARSRSSPAARAASAARSSTRSPRAGACVVAFDLDGDGARRRRRRATATAGSRSPATSPPRRRWPAPSRRRSTQFGGVDIVVSNAGIASSAVDRGDDAGRVEPQPRDPRHRLLPRRARGLPRAQAAGRRRLDRLHRLQERARRGQERRGLLVGQGRRAAPRALPGRGGRRRRHPRQHRQPRRGPAGLEDLGLLVARGARRGLQPRPRGARRALPPAQHAEGVDPTRATSPRRCCTSPPSAARASRPATCSTSTGACPPPTPASSALRPPGA